jgi:acyl-CoA thioester hydrolase
MYKHQTKIRVRYSETDQMGVVYYGNYAAYLEVGRVEFMRSIGLVYRELEEEGIIMPVVHSGIDYKFPAKYDEELTITTWVESAPTSKITFVYRIENPEGKLVVEAKVILVFLDPESFRPMRAPQKLLDLLASKNAI